MRWLNIFHNARLSILNDIKPLFYAVYTLYIYYVCLYILLYNTHKILYVCLYTFKSSGSLCIFLYHNYELKLKFCHILKSFDVTKVILEIFSIELNEPTRKNQKNATIALKVNFSKQTPKKKTRKGSYLYILYFTFVLYMIMILFL